MAYTLKRSSWGAWLQRLAAGKRLIAPVRDDAGRIIFAETGDPETIAIEPGVVEEGVKRYFYPPSEELLHFAGAGPRIRVAADTPPACDCLIFGVRPCDAAALAIADEFWAAEPADPYYLQRRERTLVIAVNCDDIVPECFCEAVSQALSQPRGMDILLTLWQDDRYLVEAMTERGQEALAATADMLPEADAEVVAVRQELAARVGERQKRRVDAGRITEATQRVFAEGAFWQEHTWACIGCGVCTFLCPTCTCFDVMDDAIGPRGYRYRCWDTCQFRQFCEEASGHDRRPQQWQRQRQRIAHKFWFSVARFGKISCVGCGRCVKLCPVNIDIAAVAAAMITASEG